LGFNQKVAVKENRNVGVAVGFCVLLYSLAFIWSCNREMKNNPVSYVTGKAVLDNNSLTPVDYMQKLLEEDAGRLTLIEMQKRGDLAIQSVELSQNLFDGIFNGLSKVYQMKIPARDSIALIYQIHTFPVLDVYCFTLYVDTTKTWVKVWQRGSRLTGNPEVDRLMLKHGLTIVWVHVDQWGRTVVDLKAIRPLNPNSLVREFEKIAGITNGVVDNSAIGEGNNITVRITGKYWVFDFSVGYEDCPAGCIFRRYWTFRVHYNGRVEYLGSYGDPPPPSTYEFYDDGC
jgi:hypothetical protein